MSDCVDQASLCLSSVGMTKAPCFLRVDVLDSEHWGLYSEPCREVLNTGKELASWHPAVQDKLQDEVRRWGRWEACWEQTSPHQAISAC